MIFATVGSQEPFDRLIRAVDEWAVLHGRSDVFAQIGDSTYCPEHIKFTKFLEPSEYNRVIHEASVVVAHAGMGAIISALEIGKPVVVMPRRGALRETRNDHQVATAERFGVRGRVIVAGSDGAERVANHSTGAEERAFCVSCVSDPVGYKDEPVRGGDA